MTIASQLAPAARATVSGILPANGKMTPELLAKKRKLAEAMYTSGIDTSPIASPWQGAARMANAALGGYDMYKADEEQKKGTASAQEKLMKALTGGDPEVLGALNDPFMTDAGSSMLMNRYKDQHDPSHIAALKQLEARKAMRDSLDPKDQASFDADPDAYMKFYYEKKQADLNSGLFDQGIGAGANSGVAAQGAPAPQSAPTGAPAASASAPAAAAGAPAAGVIPPEVLNAARAIARKDPGAALKYVQDYQIEENKRIATQGNQNTDNITAMRKEIQDIPSYKTYSAALPTWETMVEASQHDSKAADLNLIYGLAKIYDPNSVVKEGETYMVKDTASLPDWLIGTINGVQGGARLQKDTRKAILVEAQSRMNAYKNLFDKNAEQFKGIAQRHNWNEADIMPIFSPSSPIPEIPDMTGMNGAAPAPAISGNPAQDLYSKYGLKKVNP